MRKIHKIIALFTLFITPTIAFADTSALQAQAQALMQQVQQLEAQLGATSGSGSAASSATAAAPTAAANSAACPNIGRTLRMGSTGDDVTRLQQFLARDPSVYPEGIVSGYFGALTQAAVQRWQTKYNIVSSGSPSTTGYGLVGPRTAAAIALLCSSGSPSSAVGGFIQVSPVSGNAPLTVTVVANINSPHSCASALYTLDFGDGTAPQQIPLAANTCTQVAQNFTHQYLYGGTYHVVLASGSHATSATVVVNGPAAPIPGTPVVSTQPSSSFSALVQTGSVPFTTTFYVSCLNASGYDIVFGDGTDLGSSAAGNTACNGGLQSVQHTYSTAGSYQAQLQLFVLQPSGTIAPTAGPSVMISATAPQVSTSVTNYSYNSPTFNTNVGGNPLAASIQFDIPSPCTGYDISWGDGSTDDTQPDGGLSCSPSVTLKTVPHTYAAAGSYSVTLRRNASLSKVNTVAITISN